MTPPIDKLKDCVQSCHLSKFDAFKINRDQVIDIEMRRFYSCHKTHCKCLYGFWGRCLNITDICMDFEPYMFQGSITSSLFTLKALNLVKWQLWTWSFMWWCQFIDWLKLETCPGSLRTFGMANNLVLSKCTLQLLFYKLNIMLLIKTF